MKKNPALDVLVSDVKEAYALIDLKAQNEQDKDKKEMYAKMLASVSQALKKVETGGESVKQELLFESTEILSSLLDKRHGHSVTENSIFNELPRYYEGEFHKDMAALNILPPNVLTRVSEFVPEIVTFIEKIIQNGYAYASNGSVYFDTIKFSQAHDHYYAKLVPEAFGDSKALAEGEGELSCAGEEKRNPADFALWKMSKPGEPAWDSPWGRGRPGWHIECSAMAGSVFGPQMDIHSGGVDLKFPHHDNELAQSEAAFGNNNWVNFFLHSGHLHIQGCKMSKSLKNFITIKDGLKKHTSRQIRILYLLHSWKDTLDYSDQTMEGAKSFEKTCQEFFFKVKDFSRSVKFDSASAYTKFTPVEAELLKVFNEKRASVHKFLCDSINTAATMKELISLVSATNTYMSNNYNLDSYNHVLVRDIANYITNMLTVFIYYLILSSCPLISYLLDIRCH